MKKLYIPIIAFICFSLNVIAQEKSSKELKGDKYAFNYSYDRAILKYERTKNLTIEGQRKLAEGYLKTRQENQAELVYEKIVAEPSGVIAEDYYNYAMLLKGNGKYSESAEQMNKFVALKPSDLRAKDYVTNKANLSDLMNDKGNYKIVSMNINSSDQDFAPVFYKNQIVFASTRSKMKMIKRTYNLNGLPFLDMYVSEVVNEQLEQPKIFDKGLNTKQHDGPASFNKEETLIAFTRNHLGDRSEDKVVELQIYFSSYVNGEWSEAIPFGQNNQGYNVGHPNLSADGKTMYFTSDMPGGYFSSSRKGGMGNDDIYGVEFLKGLEAAKKIEGIVMDRNGVAIPKTFVTLQDNKDSILDTLTTYDDAMFSFIVDSDKSFKLIGKKETYTDGESTANTFGEGLVVQSNITLLTKKEVITEKVETETETDLGKIAELNNIYFNLDKFDLRPDAKVELNKIIAVMNDHPNLVVELSSFTDCRGTVQYNQVLSDKRAEASAGYIKQRIANPERISSKGYGKTNLTNDCYCDENVISDCSDAQHQKNRRTEFKIVRNPSIKK